MELIKKLFCRIRNNFKKNFKLIIVFIVIWTVLVITTLNNNKSTLGKASFGNEYSQCVVELNKDISVEQIVPITENSQSIAIKFATYQRRGNKGNITIEVKGTKSNIDYGTQIVDVTSLQDNAYYSFFVNEPLSFIKDEFIKIRISSNSEKGHGVGVYYSSFHYFDDSVFKINGIEQDGDLTVRYLFDDDNFKDFSNLIVSYSIIVISVLLLVLLLFEPKIEVVFVSIIFAIGIVFMFIITPLSVPDEQIHYESAIQLSNYVITPERDHTLIEEDYLSYSHYYGHYNVSMAYVRLIEQFFKPLDLDCDLAQTSKDVQYSYSAYFIPQAIGISVARLFKATVLQTFYAGRLSNLIFYCLCIYIAIKKTPVNKLLLGIVASLPIFLQTAASYSYDCFINALSILSLSLLSKWLYEDKKIQITDYVLAFLVCLGLAPAKYVYAFFAFLFILVPYQRYGSRIKKVLGTIVLISPALYQLVPILGPRLIDLFESLYNNNQFVIYADTANEYEYELLDIGTNLYSLKYVLSHLGETINLVLFTIRYNIKLWFYGAIGRYMSGQTIILPASLTYIIISLLGVSSIRKEEYTSRISTRVSYIFVCSLMGLLTVGGMLLYWTNIGDYFIQGVQGRYFCPLIPYFFSVFNNNKIKISQKVDKYVIFTYLLLIFEVIIYVLSYTFVN